MVDPRAGAALVARAKSPERMQMCERVRPGGGTCALRRGGVRARARRGSGLRNAERGPETGGPAAAALIPVEQRNVAENVADFAADREYVAVAVDVGPDGEEPLIADAGVHVEEAADLGRDSHPEYVAADEAGRAVHRVALAA